MKDEKHGVPHDPSDERPRRKSIFFILLSEHQYHHSPAFRRVEVDIRYSRQDWDALTRDAAKIGYRPERLLEKRIKRTIETGNPTSRIPHAVERRFIDHASFWEPFVTKLIYAHMSVIAGGAALDYLFNYGRQYELFYWIYLLSLVIALFALLGLKLKQFMETQERPHVPDSVTRAEIALARYSERLIWTSLAILAVTVSVRIAWGVAQALPHIKI